MAELDAMEITVKAVQLFGTTGARTLNLILVYLMYDIILNIIDVILEGIALYTCYASEEVIVPCFINASVFYNDSSFYDGVLNNCSIVYNGSFPGNDSLLYNGSVLSNDGRLIQGSETLTIQGYTGILVWFAGLLLSLLVTVVTFSTLVVVIRVKDSSSSEVHGFLIKHLSESRVLEEMAHTIIVVGHIMFFLEGRANLIVYQGTVTFIASLLLVIMDGISWITTVVPIVCNRGQRRGPIMLYVFSFMAFNLSFYAFCFLNDLTDTLAIYWSVLIIVHLIMLIIPWICLARVRKSD